MGMGVKSAVIVGAGKCESVRCGRGEREGMEW